MKLQKSHRTVTSGPSECPLKNADASAATNKEIIAEDIEAPTHAPLPFLAIEKKHDKRKRIGNRNTNLSSDVDSLLRVRKVSRVVSTEDQKHPTRRALV
jgi:hypothetical protein